MQNIIIATHGDMAQGIKHTAEFIMGKQERLHALPAYTAECLDFKEKLCAMIEEFSKDGEVIILTDLFGGSVNTDAMSFLGSHENVFLIAGVNLPLVIQLLVSDGGTGVKGVIRSSIEEAREGIVFCNDLIDGADAPGSGGFDDF